MMKTRLTILALCVCAAMLPSAAGAQTAKGTSGITPAATVTRFSTAKRAADAFVTAAEAFDTAAMRRLFGPAFEDVLLSGEGPQDRERAAEFVAKAREKVRVTVDPANPARAYLLAGNDGWPFPIPIVKRAGGWSFDTDAGRREILYRRIGSNEIDAIQICRGYVEAQEEYALQRRDGYEVNQYAQRIISTPGTQDGLTWQDKDGNWEGPIGPKIAEAIAQGYAKRTEPYHGYFFKILKGQGPDAPLGEMDFVVNGVMIGGFALVAAPAEYGVTGVKTFMVSYDGVVYEKDLGRRTLDAFAKMERFNPDRSWNPVKQP